jgi:hypothetical protein
MNPRGKSETARRPRVMRVERPAIKMNMKEGHGFGLMDVPEPLAVGGVDMGKIFPALRIQKTEV